MTSRKGCEEELRSEGSERRMDRAVCLAGQRRRGDQAARASGDPSKGVCS